MNLLQPQDRRAKDPGDTIAAVKARRRLHDLGVTLPLLRGIANVLQLKRNDVVLDVGCGDGFHLGTLTSEFGCDGHGVDISIAAVDLAARRYSACEWIVANADRFLPYSDAAFSTVASITARMNAPEFRRVIRPDGRLLVAVPSPDDLIELRGTGRDRVERTIETFRSSFAVAEQRRVTTTAKLDAASVTDLLHSIYRPIQPQPAAATQVTFSLDVLLFRPR